MTHTQPRDIDQCTDRPDAPRGPVPGTIGAFERRAGIAPGQENRFAFWITFKDSDDPISDGVAELHRRISNAKPQS